METIKVIRIERAGGPEVLELVTLPMPLPAAGELRVRAQAIGVGKPDVMIRLGIYKWMPPLPAIPGNELAGVVDAVGSGVPAHWLGQRVLVSAREMPQRGGCYAEAVCVPADAVFTVPDGITAQAAVAMPNYQMAGALLFESGAKVPGSILVHGAAGGIATGLVQLARASGISVIGVASTAAKCAFALAAGARHVIDRSTENVADQVARITGGRGVDMVLDHVGGAGFAANLDLLAPRGTLMSYNVLGGLPPENLLGELRRLLGKSLGIRCYSIHALDDDAVTRRALMQRAIDLAAQGLLQPPPATVLPLSEARRAHELLDAADVLGKIVLVPDIPRQAGVSPLNH